MTTRDTGNHCEFLAPDDTYRGTIKQICKCALQLGNFPINGVSVSSQYRDCLKLCLLEQCIDMLLSFGQPVRVQKIVEAIASFHLNISLAHQPHRARLIYQILCSQDANPDCLIEFDARSNLEIVERSSGLGNDRSSCYHETSSEFLAAARLWLFLKGENFHDWKLDIELSCKFLDASLHIRRRNQTYDLKELPNLLWMSADRLDCLGHPSLQLMLLERMEFLFGTSAVCNFLVAKVYCRMALLRARSGHVNSAAKLLAQGTILINPSHLSHDETLEWELLVGEFFANINQPAKCRECLARAGESYKALNPDVSSNKRKSCADALNLAKAYFLAGCSSHIGCQSPDALHLNSKALRLMRMYLHRYLPEKGGNKGLLNFEIKKSQDENEIRSTPSPEISKEHYSIASLYMRAVHHQALYYQQIGLSREAEYYFQQSSDIASVFKSHEQTQDSKIALGGLQCALGKLKDAEFLIAGIETMYPTISSNMYDVQLQLLNAELHRRKQNHRLASQSLLQASQKLLSLIRSDVTSNRPLPSSLGELESKFQTLALENSNGKSLYPLKSRYDVPQGSKQITSLLSLLDYKIAAAHCLDNDLAACLKAVSLPNRKSSEAILHPAISLERLKLVLLFAAQVLPSDPIYGGISDSGENYLYRPMKLINSNFIT